MYMYNSWKFSRCNPCLYTFQRLKSWKIRNSRILVEVFSWHGRASVPFSSSRLTGHLERSEVLYKRRNFRSRDELFTFDAATRGNCGQRPPLVFNRGSSSGSDKATRRRDQTRGVSRGARNLEVFFLNGRGLSCLLKWPVLVAATVAPGGLCCVRIKVFFALYIHYTVISSVGSYERSTNF